MGALLTVTMCLTILASLSSSSLILTMLSFKYKTVSISLSLGKNKSKISKTFSNRDQQGIEYDLVPNLCKDGPDQTIKIFVIEKRLRKSNKDTEVICYYYLIDGFCYQAPVMKNLIEETAYNVAAQAQRYLEYVKIDTFVYFHYPR